MAEIIFENIWLNSFYWLWMWLTYINEIPSSWTDVYIASLQRELFSFEISAGTNFTTRVRWTDTARAGCSHDLLLPNAIRTESFRVRLHLLKLIDNICYASLASRQQITCKIHFIAAVVIFNQACCTLVFKYPLMAVGPSACTLVARSSRSWDRQRLGWGRQSNCFWLYGPTWLQLQLGIDRSV